MRVLGNILWLVLAGAWLAVGYIIAGVANCLLIVTIPFGVQSFKLAGYALWPFGRVVVHRPDRDVALGCLGNALWLIFGGVWLALLHLIAGLLLCLTVVGIRSESRPSSWQGWPWPHSANKSCAQRLLRPTRRPRTAIPRRWAESS